LRNEMGVDKIFERRRAAFLNFIADHNLPPTEVGTAVFVEKMNDEGRMVVSLAEVDCAWAQLMGGKDDPNTDTATMLANAEKRFGVSMKGATPRNPVDQEKLAQMTRHFFAPIMTQYEAECGQFLYGTVQIRRLRMVPFMLGGRRHAILICSHGSTHEYNPILSVCGLPQFRNGLPGIPLPPARAQNVPLNQDNPWC